MARLKIVVGLLLVLVVVPAGSAAQGFTCRDFITQPAPQEHLGRFPADPYGLDSDGDGIACEEMTTIGPEGAEGTEITLSSGPTGDTGDDVPLHVVPGPFAIADGLEVSYYYFGARTSDGAYPNVFGEVRNLTEVPLQAPSMLFTLFDAAGNIAGAVSAHVLYERIEPGETMPFSGPFFPSVAPESLGEWETESIAVCYGGGPVVEDDYSPGGLRLVEVEETERSGRFIQIEGTVVNERDEPARFVVATAAFHDRHGRYIGDLSARVPVDIPAGRTAPFSIDHGFNTFHSFNPMDYSVDRNFTYELSVGIDTNVRIGCA